MDHPLHPPDIGRPPLDGKQLQQAITARPGLPVLPVPDAGSDSRRRGPMLVYWPVIRLAAAAAAGTVFVAVLVLRFTPTHPNAPASPPRERRLVVPADAKPAAMAVAKGDSPRRSEAVPVAAIRRRADVGPPARPAPPSPDADIEARLRLSEHELREQLIHVPELRLFGDADMQAVRRFEAKTERQIARGAVPELVDYTCNENLHRALQMAAARSGLALTAESKTVPDAALALHGLSRELRGLGFAAIPGQRTTVHFPSGRAVSVRGTNIRFGSPAEKLAAFDEWCAANGVGKYRAALPGLVYMLQVEDEEVRLRLVRELARASGTPAAALLAGRAMADLSPAVRRAAVAALKSFPPAQYESYFLKGLRYPWPAVADHAADALVQLNAHEAVPRLVELIDLPDPMRPAPEPGTGKVVARELVRLNHLRNCLLCHAASEGPHDGLVRAPVPTPGRPLPPADFQVGRGSPDPAPRGDFIRADRAFLRPDFSASLPVGKDDPWPTEQRFDFVVRTLHCKPEDLPPALKRPTGYPQRQAVLYALRRLTGQDAGDSAARWRELISATARGAH